MDMAGNDKTFFVELGKRVALARKDHGMTQQQLAEALGIAQQTLAHYEGARLRVPASMLPPETLQSLRARYAASRARTREGCSVPSVGLWPCGAAGGTENHSVL